MAVGQLRRSPLYLPEFRRSPSPPCQRLAGLRDSSQEQQQTNSLCMGRSGSRCSRSRQPSRRMCGDDFLECSSASVRNNNRSATRQAIDDNTSVPADLHQRLLRLGREAHARKTHVFAFEPSSGQPFLLHHDAERLRAERRAASSVLATAQRSSSGLDVPVSEVHSSSNTADTSAPASCLLQRSGSSCAMEVGRPHALDKSSCAMEAFQDDIDLGRRSSLESFLLEVA